MAGYLTSASLALAWAVLVAAQANAKDDRQPVACQQVFFSDHQLQSLAQDRPLRDLLLSNEHLFVLGQQHVWRFDLGKSSLRRFNFAPSSSLRDAYLGRDNDTGAVYLATPQILFVMRGDEPKVKKYFQKPLTGVFDFTVAPKNYIWFTTQGISLLDRQSLQLRRVNYSFKPDDRVVVEPALRSFFVLRGDRLLWIDGTLQAKEILRADGLQIGTDDQAVYVQRDEAVLRYSFAGELLQTIPVQRSRRLVGMHFTFNLHSYLFSDGIIEHYQLPNKRVSVGKCMGNIADVMARTRTANRPDLDVFAGRLAFVRADNPYMYELRK